MRVAELAEVPNHGPPCASAAAAQLHRIVQHGDADGIAEGTPSVVSEAIDWPPDHRKAPIDDVHQMARVPAIGSPIRMPRRRASGARASQSRRLEAWKAFLAA